MPVMMEAYGLEQLSIEDRLRLAEELWESIAAKPEGIPVTEAQRQDLQRRLDAYRDDPKAGSPWEEVKARLRSKPG
jgi:putative addiction module component (TIGR02574 family)